MGHRRYRDIHHEQQEHIWVAAKKTGTVVGKHSYPLVICQQLAMENGPFSSLIYPLNMVIFHSYVNVYQAG